MRNQKVASTFGATLVPHHDSSCSQTTTRSALPRLSRSQRCFPLSSPLSPSSSRSSSTFPHQLGSLSLSTVRGPSTNTALLPQTVVHYGWIPLILYVGWSSSNPRPPFARFVSSLSPPAAELLTQCGCLRAQARLSPRLNSIASSSQCTNPFSRPFLAVRAVPVRCRSLSFPSHRLESRRAEDVCTVLEKLER